MEILLATIGVFLLSFLALAIGRFRGRHCLNCSCKAAERIMRDPKHAGREQPPGHGPAKDDSTTELNVLE